MLFPTPQNGELTLRKFGDSKLLITTLTPEGKVSVKLTLPGTSPSGCTSPAHPGLHRRWPLVNYFQDTGRATSTPRFATG